MRWISGGLPASVAPRLLSAVRDAERRAGKSRVSANGEPAVETVDA